MKRKKILSTAFVFMFLMVSFWLSAEESKNTPVAVSPGSDTEAVSVWQSCPTFSWSAVDQASSYRIVVFEVIDPKVLEYENAVAMTSPVISKDIPGRALSWTLSSEKSLKTGSMYAWYVQAIDAYGNALGNWSNGKIFQVEQEIRFAGIEEKLGEILKSYGVNEERITSVLRDLESEVKEVIVRGSSTKDTVNNNPGRSGVQGYEGSANTYFGQFAGLAITSGICNTFIGSSAGSYTTTGCFNTFLGHDCGQQNTTGNDNTFVGNSAGGSNIGNGNTFIGKWAGYYNTGGGGNIFIGKYAGNSNTTGCTNIFLGNSAGYNSTTSNDNIFIGEQAGYYNTTGVDNIFIGMAAGNKNTTGNSNIFLGDASGFYNTTGNDNTFLGYYTGNFNTTGRQNTFIGSLAGRSNSTGIGNVFLGRHAGYLETGSNMLYIANSDTSSPLIYGEFDNSIVTINGKLGIGTKTPTYVLEVNRTGTPANFVCKQTDGASAVISADSSHVFIGAKTNHDFRLLANDSPKITILPSGYVGFGRNTPSYPLHMASGAYCSTGGTWTNASSRSLKENIQSLSTSEAVEVLNKLNPVKYNYKVDKTDRHVGFIAEDAPELVATSDRKGLSPMDITAVLTRVVQKQQKMIQEQQQLNQEYKKIISDLQERIARIEKER